MATKRTPGTDVRDALVSAGHRVLAAKGVRGLTVRAVATEAGVAPMGVYNHLDGKDGLVAVIVSDGFERLRATTAGTLDSDARQRLRESGRRYRRFALENPTLYRLMFSEECNLGGDAGLAALGALTEIVRYAQAAGVVRDDDAFELTLAIWSCVHGAVSLELDGAAPIPVDRDAIFESVLDLIENGVTAR
ncbi:TetR/AcrR family transcriptional regulator [Williamsia maris]|uniref:Transcriptional regulator, TetR family n=1 Tax=Williamsia maris TaxID=72806 RepID=A0ABT1HHL8_9NOCA|nr:TetR/AcrR family transcriptional regulator [Williamsia maris]MCP2176505.1 transcriptional regulator, TetR family [Williamsia maris]